jgi:hypothetical protein
LYIVKLLYIQKAEITLRRWIKAGKLNVNRIGRNLAVGWEGSEELAYILDATVRFGQRDEG